jgi:hypothetical protein
MIKRLRALKSALQSRVVNAWYERLLVKDWSGIAMPDIECVASFMAELPYRPRLLLLPNVRGWAFDDQCRQRVDHLAATWDCDLLYVNENPEIDPSRYDLMFNPNQGYMKYDSLFHGRYVRGFFSLKWARTGLPAKSVYKSTRGAIACVGPSREIVDGLRRYCPDVFLVQEGIDPRVFFRLNDRKERNLVVGWTGNPDRDVKRLQSVVIPACKAAGVELRIAMSLTPAELNRFYNGVDLILMASVPHFEGNPLSIYEAGACGRTVLATNTGTVPEIIENGRTGFIVAATNDNEQTIRDISERLVWCKENLSETRIMGANLHEKVLAERIPKVTCETFRIAMEQALFRSLTSPNRVAKTGNMPV